MTDYDILAEIETIAAHADAKLSAPSVLGQVVNIDIINRQARLFGRAVLRERCRQGMALTNHHFGIREAVAACIRHRCGVSHEEVCLVRLVNPSFLAELENGTLGLVQSLTLLTSVQGLFIVKGFGYSDSEITSQKMERFLLQKGDWWV